MTVPRAGAEVEGSVHRDAAAPAGRGAAVVPFAARLEARIAATGSRVCLGLDPRPSGHPLMASRDAAEASDRIVAFATAVLRGAAPSLACVKPQSAFFEVLGAHGARALEALVAEARALDLPVVMDAKRGDIGSTAEAYADAYLGDGPLGSDALTVSPYLGFDTLEPFVRAAALRRRGVFVLVSTSNPGSDDLQGLRTHDGRRLDEHVADAVAAAVSDHPSPRGYGHVGAVVGATRAERLAALRTRMPRAVLLVPGYGAQGATADDVTAAFDEDGFGAVVNSSRGLTPGAAASTLADVEREAERRARSMAAALDGALRRR